MAPSKPTLELDIQFAIGRKGLPRRRAFRRWAKAALRGDAVVALRIVDTAEGLQLNQDFRGKAYATNVLTFAYDEAGDLPPGVPMSGDIVLCAPVIAREADEQDKALEAHYAHMVVHGMLHLQGYDHETGEADALAMEAVEGFIMRRLGFPDPYL